MIYLRDSALTPYGVAAWPTTPAHAEIFRAKAQGRVVDIPGALTIHAVGVWWGIGHAPGIPWEVFAPYLPAVLESMQQYDRNILGGAIPYPQHALPGVYLFPLPAIIDAVTGAVDQPYQSEPPADEQGY